jgi:PKD repeat protein
MERPGLYVTDLPHNKLRGPGSIANRLVYFILPALVVVLVAGSLYWLQWASHLGITLGYPTPTVYITSTVSNPLMVHDTAQFSARATGRDISYVWDFGDGSSGFGSSVNHTYESNGSFTVTVRATDAINQTSTDTTSVRVIPPAPTASFTYSESYSGYVYFDASASMADPSTSIANYSWDFGDGTTDSTSSPQEYHQYYNTGTYQVSLVVTDATGQSSSAYTASAVIY